jgi:hypothetical protein
MPAGTAPGPSIAVESTESMRSPESRLYRIAAELKSGQGKRILKKRTPAITWEPENAPAPDSP